ncbi:MAG: hypothetical protein KatS3mg087_1299 [Patescibacteria group bacterium]|nr:MAG: hypothetical protein KatS3mg087_1299 [Patescibacteria group bacterium]
MTPEDLFRPQNLNLFIEKFATFEARTKFADLYGQDTTDVDFYSWDEISYPRELAPFTHGDAPAVRLDLMGKTHRATSIAHILVDKFISGRKIFFQERAPGELRPNAMAVVASEIRDMMNRISRSIEYLAAKAFTGSLTVNSSTVPGSSVSFTLTFAVQTYTPSASWATPTTKIFSSELHTLKRDFVRTSGVPLRHIIHGTNVEKYLLQNDEAQAWLAATQRGVQVFDTGLLGNAVGVSFEAYDHVYTLNGTVTPYLGDNAIVGFTDEALVRQYCKLVLGKGLIPRGAFGTSPDQLVTPAPSYGFYSYVVPEFNPVGIRVFVGWAGVPIITYPELIVYSSNVAP